VLALLASVVAFVAEQPARAELVSLELNGYVSSVVGNPFQFGLSGGESFAATFTYDTSIPPINSRQDQTIYFQTNSYSVTVGSHHFSPVANDWFVFMSDNAGGGDFITFSAGSYPAGYGTIAIDGVANPNAGFIIYLVDTTGTVWNSVALPQSPFPPLSAFNALDYTVFSDNTSGILAETFKVTITGLREVPEPGVFGLVSLGMILLGVRLQSARTKPSRI
jgi:hypothetical protein